MKEEITEKSLSAVAQAIEKLSTQQSLQGLYIKLLAIWSVGSVLALWCRLLC